MKRSLYLGKISGIKVSIHWTFLILVLWIILYQVFKGHGVLETLRALAFLFAVFTCITLHELGHALAAKRYKFKTLGIILLPIGGLARMEGLPEKPLQELVVAIMGPIVNVVIAFVLFVVLYFSNSYSASVLSVSVTGSQFWVQLYNINLFLALFNLLPAFPMDGGRVFRALLSMRVSRIKATRIASYTGQLMAILFIFFGFTYSPMLIVIGVFIFLGAQAEANAAEARSSLSGIKVEDVLMHRFSTLSVEDSLSKAVSLLLDGQERFFIIKQDREVKGTLGRRDIISGLTRYGADISLEEVMNKDVKSFQSDTLIQDILFRLSARGDDNIFPVYSGTELIGIINLENIQEYLMVKDALTLHPENNHTLDLGLK